MKKILVFASGRGSNFKAILQATQSGVLQARIVGLVTDRPGCGASLTASEFGITSFEIPLSTGKKKLSRSEHEAEIITAIENLDFDLIVLAGYMRVFTAEFIRRYEKIVNIHPSLLPAFPGVDAYGQALRFGAKVTGVTIHWVAEGVDDGPIIMQRAFEIEEGESVESLTTRGLEVEHRLYVDALKKILEDQP